MLDLHSLIEENTKLHAELAEMRQLQQTLITQRDFAFQLMDTMGQGLTVLDKDGKFEYINPAYARMVGYSIESLLGQIPAMITVPEDEPLLIQARQDRRRGLTTSYEVRLRSAAGDAIHVFVTGAPRFDEQHHVVGTISVITDMTDYKRLEATIVRKTQLIELVRQVASAANGAKTLKDAVDQSMDSILASAVWELSHVYLPDPTNPDYLVSSGWWYGARRTSVEPFREMTETMPVLRGNGLPGQVYATGSPVWFIDMAASGTLKRASAAHELGIKTACAFPIVLNQQVVAILEMFAWETIPPATDIIEVMSHIGVQLGYVSERQQAQLDLQRQQDFLQVILNNITDGIIACDTEGAIIQVNRAWAEFHGLSSKWLSEELYQLPQEIFAADGITPLQEHEIPLNRALNGDVFSNLELTIKPSQRATRILIAQGQPLKTAKGDQIGALVVVHDVTRQKLLEQQRETLIQQLQTASMTDMLTNVYNRRGWFMQAQPLWEQAQFRYSLGIMMLDIDFFKQINDTYGHGIGDAVLQVVAGRCCRCVRASDCVGRYGGEEFVIILPQTDLATVCMVAERMRASFEAEPIPTSIGAISLTVSIGVAMWDTTIPDLDHLVDRADTALYQAKRNGRNQIQVWQR